MTSPLFENAVFEIIFDHGPRRANYFFRNVCYSLYHRADFSEIQIARK
jgi:hypothetical protein